MIKSEMKKNGSDVVLEQSCKGETADLCIEIAGLIVKLGECKVNKISTILAMIISSTKVLQNNFGQGVKIDD